MSEEDKQADLHTKSLPKMPVFEMFSWLQRNQDELLTVYQTGLSSGSTIGDQHFYLCGIANRALAQTRAFKHCVEDRNELVAAALLRLQLDTALRLYALFWVTDPNDFAKQVFHGKQIDTLKAADGQQMRDKYLRKKLVGTYPWVETVYKQTSGAIHFSNRHIFSALDIKNAETGEAQFKIGPNVPDQPLDDYADCVAAFLHINMIIVAATRDWFERFDPFRTVNQ